jgi:acetyl esterase/lipase
VISQRERIYASPTGLPLRYDFFRPQTEETVPLVVCIHGGGWISGDPSDMYEIAQILVLNGFAAACPQYRLAPLHPYPAAVEDTQTFVRFARAQAEEWNVDPNRFASLGISAGGHLALMLGLTNPVAPADWPRESRSQVNAVVDICGIADVTAPRETHFDISRSFLDQFMAVPYEGNEDRFREASPLYHVTPDDPPMLVVHGEDDDVVPVAQSDALVEKLRNAGVEVEYHRLPGERHAFSFESYTQITQWILTFLKDKLR